MTFPHVCIMTPSYDGKFTAEYLDSIVSQFQQTGYRISYRYSPGDSLVSRARNFLFAEFIEKSKENGWTHLLWLDGDVGIAPESIGKMLARNVDVVAAPVPMKLDIGPHGWSQSVIKLIEEVEPMFYKVEYAATGCLMFSLNAAEALVENCKEKGLEYYDNKILWDVFTNGAVDGFYESEDWHVCRVLRELGFDIYADSSFWVSHVDAPRLKWFRGPWPLAETIIAGDYNGKLPDEIRFERWSTNDC